MHKYARLITEIKRSHLIYSIPKSDYCVVKQSRNKKPDQQALSLLLAMPFPNRKQAVLIEQPSYHLLIKLLEMHDIPVFGIERTMDGIDLNELERVVTAVECFLSTGSAKPKPLVRLNVSRVPEGEIRRGVDEILAELGLFRADCTEGKKDK